MLHNKFVLLILGILIAMFFSVIIYQGKKIEHKEKGDFEESKKYFLVFSLTVGIVGSLVVTPIIIYIINEVSK